MAKGGFYYHGVGANVDITEAEAKSAAVPCLVITSSVLFWGISAILIFYKCKSDIDKKTEASNKAREYKNEGETEGNGNNTSEPIVRQASEIPVVDGSYDDHQLVGKLLYREDICLCYGVEHCAKTSIILNWVIDMILRCGSCIMADDKGVHPPYTCLWYNGEMNDGDFQNFFGDFDRHRLDGKLAFVDDFAYMTLKEWLIDVEKRLLDYHTDTIVVLDNISCISNSTDAEVRNLKNTIVSMQANTKERGFYTTFIIIDHINKQGNVAGTYKLQSLFSNRMRFDLNGNGHTKITIEKNRKYHDMIDRSIDLLWTTAPEGYKSYKNQGEKVTDNISAPNSDNQEGNQKVESKDVGYKYSDEEILKFHEVFHETGNKSEAQRLTGVTRQAYDKRIGKLQ